MLILSLLTHIDGSTRTKFSGIVNDQLVASCELDHDQAQAHVTTLYSLYVDPTHWGKGYATDMVYTAIEAAQAHGKTAVNLRVHEANTAAINLYKQAGFEQYEGPDGEEFVWIVRWL